MPEQAFLTIQPQETVTLLILEGSLNTTGVADIWQNAMGAVTGARKPVIVDISKITFCDGAGVSLIKALQAAGASETTGITPEIQRDLDRLTAPIPSANRSRRLSPVAGLGKITTEMISDWWFQLGFVGELFAETMHALRYPRSVRWADTFNIAETAGVNALPLISLVSFLVGLILAFQAAIPMKMFGAELFVADLVGLSMVREMGPLMTAIVLAGRSGSAFAAEIGTMKINEEIDALKTMGQNPMRFLVLPRVVAAVAVTPFLAVYSNIVGILGGSVVLLTMGYPLPIYFTEMARMVTWVDFTGGIIKCFFFGILIAGVGCMRGIQTGSGPSAVGASTTRAVVSSIVLITITDGIFAVVYYALGI